MRRTPRISMRRWLSLFALVNLLVLLGIVSVRSALTAIAAPDSQAAIQMDIDLDEWELIPEDLTFQAGDTVNFNISNIGRFPHAIEVSNSAVHLHSPTIRADETTTLEVTFEYGGEYTYLCPIPGHAELGMVGTLTVEGGDPPPDEGYLGIPLMRVRPGSGTEVEGRSQEVSVILHDFTLAPDDIGDAQNTPGEGHWALFLNDQLVESVGTPSYMLENLPAGEHDIRVELRNNDGTPLDPPVEASTTVQVPRFFVVPPSVGDLAPSTWTLVGLTTLGVLLLGSGALVLVRRRR